MGISRIVSARGLAALLVGVSAATLLAHAASQNAGAAQSTDVSALRALRWRGIGPANPGGRVTVIAGLPGVPEIFYVAGADGGIIKTENGGTTFKPIFDKQPVASIGAIAIAPCDPERDLRRHRRGKSAQQRVVRRRHVQSIDAGEHWTHIGLEDSERITRIVVDTANPDVVYVCGLGREWGPNEERGVFHDRRRQDVEEGALSRPRTPAAPTSRSIPATRTASTPACTRSGVGVALRSGGGKRPCTSRSTAATRGRRSPARGLPTKAMDRIGVGGGAEQSEHRVHDQRDEDEGELWRSDDARRAWATVNRDPQLSFRPFYYGDHPRRSKEPEPRIRRSRAACICRKTAGATSAAHRTDVHGDHQAMWIDPLNPKRILSGSDGGLQVSYDGSENWEVVNNFSVHAVLSHQLRHAEAVHGVRRAAGQRQLVRAERDDVHPGQPQERLVHRVRRRRLLHRARTCTSRGSSTPTRRAA